MIFVTVGTHEQPFDRLLAEVDKLRGEGVIDEPVVMQTGFSVYNPRYCEKHKLLSYPEMAEYVAKARIVITHGGPASFIMPLQIGKIPIVVPRQSKFNEHVNNHQVDFTRAVAARMGNIIPVYDISELEKVIVNYDAIALNANNIICNNNKQFNNKLEILIDNLFEDDDD